VSLAVDVSADGIRVPLSRERVRDIARLVLRAQGIREALLSVTFVSRPFIARLNRRHLGHAGPTDVITFALGGARRGAVLGDIYICPDVARDNARAAGVGMREELARLVVHGTLHALGHAHPDGDGRAGSAMWALQERLVRRAASRVGW
jgi:probable rRNA maturation factor